MGLPQRKNEELNLYGDKPFRLSMKHGTDISSSRLDDLDRSAISYVLNTNQSATCVDLGSGFGHPGIIMAMLGAEYTAYDKIALKRFFNRVSKSISLERIKFQQADLRLVDPDDFPEEIDLLYSQRFIHYLKYNEAETLLNKLIPRMNKGSRAFLSASGLSSELGRNYAHKKFDVTKRYAILSKATALRHDILTPVCLYREEELVQLCEGVGLRPVKVWSSKFGNIKAIFER